MSYLFSKLSEQAEHTHELNNLHNLLDQECILIQGSRLLITSVLQQLSSNCNTMRSDWILPIAQSQLTTITITSNRIINSELAWFKQYWCSSIPFLEAKVKPCRYKSGMGLDLMLPQFWRPRTLYANMCSGFIIPYFLFTLLGCRSMAKKVMRYKQKPTLGKNTLIYLETLRSTKYIKQ